MRSTGADTFAVDEPVPGPWLSRACANSAIEEAQAGWVGASAAALQAKFVEWQEATAEMTGDIAAHGEAFRAAAAGYADTDAHSARKLDDEL